MIETLVYAERISTTVCDNRTSLDYILLDAARKPADSYKIRAPPKPIILFHLPRLYRWNVAYAKKHYGGSRSGTTSRTNPSVSCSPDTCLIVSSKLASLGIHPTLVARFDRTLMFTLQLAAMCCAHDCGSLSSPASLAFAAPGTSTILMESFSRALAREGHSPLCSLFAGMGVLGTKQNNMLWDRIIYCLLFRSGRKGI
jgi:hypothetical protein